MPKGIGYGRTVPSKKKMGAAKKKGGFAAFLGLKKKK